MYFEKSFNVTMFHKLCSMCRTEAIGISEHCSKVVLCLCMSIINCLASDFRSLDQHQLLSCAEPDFLHASYMSLVCQSCCLQGPPPPHPTHSQTASGGEMLYIFGSPVFLFRAIKEFNFINFIITFNLRMYVLQNWERGGGGVEKVEGEDEGEKGGVRRT